MTIPIDVKVPEKPAPITPGIWVRGIPATIASSREKEEAITEYVMTVVDRAVTSHISRGEHSKVERRTLTIICTPAESMKIKKFVAETDPQAFATIMPVTTVWGKRFSDITEVDNV